MEGGRSWTSGVALIALVLTGIEARPARGQEAAAGCVERDPVCRLTLRILLESPPGGLWLRTAESVLDQLLAGAGIGVERVHCGEGNRDYCAGVPTVNEFVVRVQDRRLDPRSHSCGVSLRPWAGTGHFLTVYRDCLQAASHELSVPEGVLAAYTIAHEVGHLLLPVGHARHGIMRARPDRADWRQAASGTLRFSEEEARQMRAALQARAQQD